MSVSFPLQLLTVTYSVEGNNPAVFVSRLARAGVRILGAANGNVKKSRVFLNFSKENVNSEKIYITIPHSDSEKLFAICKEMCYNIKSGRENIYNTKKSSAFTVEQTGTGGLLKPLVFLKNRLGIVFGICLFILFAVFLNGRLLGVSLDGVPRDYKSSVSVIVKESGLANFSDISSFNFDGLEKEILNGVKGLGFVSVKKRGSFIYVSAIAKELSLEDKRADNIVSPVGGEIVSVSVLRGTALCKPGDVITKGQNLVGGFFSAGTQLFKTVPKAVIEIKTYDVYRYTLSCADEYALSAVTAVCKEKCRFSNIIDCNTDVKKVKDGYEITVTVCYVYVLGGY